MIRNLGIDSLLIFELKQIAKVEFHTGQNTADVIKKHKFFPFQHGVQIGFFKVAIDTENPALNVIRHKWQNRGYMIHTMKYRKEDFLIVKII